MMNKEKIINIFEKFKNQSILVIGDIMLDEYIIGKTNRISPEAPVPVVDIEKTFRVMGGSGNVISNIVSLGGNVIPCGIVGDDKDGEFIRLEIDKMCELSEIVIDNYKRLTTKKTRIFSDNQQMLRVDTESKEPIDKLYKEDIFEFIKDYINSYSAIIISDYQKGLFDYDFTQEIIKFGRSNNKLIFVDPKGDCNKYGDANFITPNLKELSMMSNMAIGTDEEIYDAGDKLYHYLNLDGLVVTRGKDGISVIRNDGHKMITLPTMAKEVFDVSGCGDTVIATFALSHLSGMSMDDSAELANLTASIVASKLGTSTATLDEILEIL